MKASREFYELRVAKFGDEHYCTIDAGIFYASDLQEANRGGEARELLTKLLTTSKRVLGPHHNTTKKVENQSSKRSMKLPMKIVSIDSNLLLKYLTSSLCLSSPW
jgi:hypothetical protein